jgi:DNA-binding GntR family transcriptional regulator
VLSAGARAYEFIKEGIVSGRFRPGYRLKEDELTVLCRVSRTPVREALKRLAIEGLVVVTPNAGAHVAAVDDLELEEIYALRAMIEGHAARRAAASITADDIERLKALAAAMEEALRAGGEDMQPTFTNANAEFHHIILRAANSPRLLSMATLVIELPLTLRTFARYSERDRIRSAQHHRDLIDAFESRNGDWASLIMKSHVQAAFCALVRTETD